MTARRISDFGISIGKLPRGPRNALTDVPGVAVGHCTVRTQAWNTGVTVILPAQDNLFLAQGRRRVPGSQRLWQDAGPDAAGGAGHDRDAHRPDQHAQRRPCARRARGSTASTRAMRRAWRWSPSTPSSASATTRGFPTSSTAPSGTQQVMEAISSAGADFAQGCVGAGTGTVCHSLKGGIGRPPACWRWTARPMRWARSCRRTTACSRTCASTARRRPSD